MKKVDFDSIREVFQAALDLGDYELKLDSQFEEVPEWDSLGHMRIVYELEAKFDIEFDIEEIIDVDTVEKIMIPTQSKLT